MRSFDIVECLLDLYEMGRNLKCANCRPKYTQSYSIAMRSYLFLYLIYLFVAPQQDNDPRILGDNDDIRLDCLESINSPSRCGIVLLGLEFIFVGEE